jgi:hypothetical protein
MHSLYVLTVSVSYTNVCDLTVKCEECTVYANYRHHCPVISADTDNYNHTNELHFTSQLTGLVNWCYFSLPDSSSPHPFSISFLACLN